MIISGALNIDMNFKRLCELCLTGNNKLNESFNYFNGLYELCLEAKSKKYITITSNRENILKEFEKNKETASDEYKKEIKTSLIKNLLLPQSFKIINTEEDADGSVHYDIKIAPDEILKASIVSANNSNESNISIIVKDVNNLLDINNAIVEIEEKLEEIKKEETVYKRELETDFIHHVGYAPPSNVPDRGYYKIGMKPFKDKYGRTRSIEYDVDPTTTKIPDVGTIEELDGQQVAILEADRHNTRGSNMGGPLHPFLLSNQTIAKLPDGRGYKPVWANMTSAFVTRAKNIIKNTTAGYALIQIMKEDAHKSNKKFVNDFMEDIEKIKSSMSKDNIDALHVILDLGAKNPSKHLKRLEALEKQFEKGEIGKEEYILNKDEETKKVEKFFPMIEFLKGLAPIKSKTTKGNIEEANRLFTEHNNNYKNQDWYVKIVNKYQDWSFIEEASTFTFNQRSSSMTRIKGLPFIPSLQNKLLENMDFNNALNLEIVAAVQLTKDMDAFAIYTGNDAKQDSKMSEKERYLKEQFINNQQFRVHPSYDWMMLGPEDGKSFILETPVHPIDLFPNYASEHRKETVRTGTKETIVGTMKKSKIPLIIKLKK
jgi:hypothetical protein